MVLIVFLLLRNHGNLILKIHQQINGYLNEGLLFIGGFKVGNVPEVINKEVLTQFIYKPT